MRTILVLSDASAERLFRYSIGRQTVFRLLSVIAFAILPGTAILGKNPDIVCEGNATYESQQIIAQVHRHPDFVNELESNGSSDELATIVARLVRTGYRDGGFLRPGIECEWVDGKLHCAISEGVRYRCGGIHVTGSRLFTAEQLVSHLTSRQPKDGTHPDYVFRDGKKLLIHRDEQGDEQELREAVWQLGEPARFDHSLEQDVVDAIADLGYLNPSVEVDQEADHDNAIVNLSVIVTSDGEPSMIRKIHIASGTEKSHGEIIRFVGVKEGQICDAELIRQVTERLWQCGRFHSVNVSFDCENHHLVLDLEDKFGTPPLSEPISELGMLFLAAGRSLADAGRRDAGDACWEANVGSIHMNLISSQAGLMFQVHAQESDELGAPEKISKLTLLAEHDRLLVDFNRHEQYVEIQFPHRVGSLNFTTEFGASNEAERLWAIRGDAKLSSDRGPGQPAIRRTFSFRPCDWLPFAYRTEFEVTETESDVTVSEKHAESRSRFAIDRASGRVKELIAMSGPLQFHPGEFERQRRTLRISLETKRNSFRNEKPITSVVNYLLDRDVRALLDVLAKEVNYDVNLIGPAADVCERLVQADLLAFVDESFLYFANRETSNERFQIGHHLAERNDNPHVVRNRAQAYLNQIADGLPTETWPEELVRASGDVIFGPTASAKQTLRAFLEDRDHGPLSLGSLAVMMDVVHHPAAKIVAKFAVARLNPANFSRELNALLELPLGPSIVKSISAFRVLTKEEASVLLAVMPNEQSRRLVEAFISAYRPQLVMPSMNANKDSEISNAIFRVSEQPFRRAMSAIIR
ncbi:MAG: hypothetical protein AAF802_12295 [Planctomycetota bacterium]